MTLIVDEEYLHDPSADNWIQDYYDKLVTKKIIPEFAEAPLSVEITFATLSVLHGVVKHAIFAGVYR